jgi:hypothetical protein
MLLALLLLLVLPPQPRKSALASLRVEAAAQQQLQQQDNPMASSGNHSNNARSSSSSSISSTSSSQVRALATGSTPLPGPQPLLVTQVTAAARTTPTLSRCSSSSIRCISRQQTAGRLGDGSCTQRRDAHTAVMVLSSLLCNSSSSNPSSQQPAYRSNGKQQQPTQHPT